MRVALAALAAMMTLVPVLARDNGQYDNVDPRVRQWFQTRKVPGGPNAGMICCNISDGVYAEEDIREGHYWTRFVTPAGPSGWLQVPDELVLPEGNPNGVPVVWFWLDSGHPVIRCFAPGAGT